MLVMQDVPPLTVITISSGFAWKDTNAVFTLVFKHESTLYQSIHSIPVFVHIQKGIEYMLTVVNF